MRNLGFAFGNYANYSFDVFVQCRPTDVDALHKSKFYHFLEDATIR